MTRAGLDDGGRFDEATATLGAPPRRFDLIPFSEITFSDGLQWLVKGLLPATGLATIFGPPKMYKSFVAADLALHIAAGRAWAGRRVRQGAVVYIVGEGATGFSDRIAANRARCGYPADLPFYLIRARPNLGVIEGDRSVLIAAIETALPGVPIAAIFIDTLVRTLAGASENDEGMRCFTDNAEAISEHFACLSAAVHHTGKDQDRGMRGSSALHGAIVSSWKVEKSKPFEARITLVDAKDGESGLVWTAQLERYVYGRDEDGDEKATLVIGAMTSPEPEGRKADGDEPAKPSVPAQMRLFIDCLDNALGASGRSAKPFPDGPAIQVVSLDAVRAVYSGRRADAAEDAKRKAFAYSLKGAVERKIVIVGEISGEKVAWKSSAR